jgi:DNA-binding response OmpR family regulator
MAADRAHDGSMALMPARLLMLEDDEGLRTSLRLVMEDQGYEVVEAADAETALNEVARESVDLMMVDLMLGGMDGYSFIRRARPETDAPIVVLSARDGTQDIVAALEAGADDYVTKPFVVEEIQARLRALLRRPARQDEAGSRAGDLLVLDRREDLVFDTAGAVLRRGDRVLPLTNTEYRVLGALASQPGRVLSRSALLEHVWQHGFFGDERVVDVHIRRLRKKLESEPSAPRVLVTVRGLGYRLDVR